MKSKGNSKHGLRRHSAYNSWNNMMFRCNNPKSPDWYLYGGRGIKVCERWHCVKNFVADMGEKKRGLTLDRIDNSKGYFKSNCRWATHGQQGSNTRRNVRLVYRGKDMTLAEWSRALKISRNTIKKRWRLGWSARRIIETPVENSLGL